MTPERWQQVRDLLEEALELAPEQRSDFLRAKLLVRSIFAAGNRNPARLQP